MDASYGEGMTGAAGLDGMGDMHGPTTGFSAGIDQGREMEASFKAFLERPENRPLVEAHQRKEAMRAVKMKQRQMASDFQQKVLQSHPEARQAIGPFLKNPALRRVIQTFTNDPEGDVSRWATNPEVLRMLRQAQEVMDKGLMTPTELEAQLLAHLSNPGAKPGQEAQEAASRQVQVPLDTEQLVHALNEHLTERRKGNAAYQRRDFAEALGHYDRARAVVDFVKGISAADQDEIDANRVLVYLNIAAVCLATGRTGNAVHWCGRALELDGGSVKGHLRLARAHLARHEHEECTRCLERVEQLEPGNQEAERMRRQMLRLKEAARSADHVLCGKMLSADS